MAKPASIVINAGIVQRMSNDAAFLAQFPFLKRANNTAPVKSCCNRKKAAANAQGASYRHAYPGRHASGRDQHFATNAQRQVGQGAVVE
jgi:hypothetical protein